MECRQMVTHLASNQAWRCKAIATRSNCQPLLTQLYCYISLCSTFQVGFCVHNKETSSCGFRPKNFHLALHSSRKRRKFVCNNEQISCLFWILHTERQVGSRAYSEHIYLHCFFFIHLLMHSAWVVEQTQTWLLFLDFNVLHDGLKAHWKASVTL